MSLATKRTAYTKNRIWKMPYQNPITQSQDNSRRGPKQAIWTRMAPCSQEARIIGYTKANGVYQILTQLEKDWKSKEPRPATKGDEDEDISLDNPSS